eukprot:m.34231 g.34231  ORF g.34231 m.34231 type:complete len:130 (-) comp9750_c0_seq1:978-1367(-)
MNPGAKAPFLLFVLCVCESFSLFLYFDHFVSLNMDWFLKIVPGLDGCSQFCGVCVACLCVATNDGFYRLCACITIFPEKQADERYNREEEKKTTRTIQPNRVVPVCKTRTPSPPNQKLKTSKSSTSQQA